MCNGRIDIHDVAFSSVLRSIRLIVLYRRKIVREIKNKKDDENE